jgi:phosphocarrier protein HPr
MKRARISIPWERGLHLRPAARIVKSAQSFSSSIALKVNERIADARSIFGILLLSATLGTAVELEVSGVDEDVAMAAISSIFDSGEEGSIVDGGGNVGE